MSGFLISGSFTASVCGAAARGISGRAILRKFHVLGGVAALGMDGGKAVGRLTTMRPTFEITRKFSFFEVWFKTKYPAKNAACRASEVIAEAGRRTAFISCAPSRS